MALVGWWCLLAYLYYLNAPDARHQKVLRLGAWTVIGVVLLMAALFFATPVRQAPLDLTNVLQRDERAWPKVVYQLI